MDSKRSSGQRAAGFKETFVIQPLLFRSAGEANCLLNLPMICEKVRWLIIISLDLQKWNKGKCKCEKNYISSQCGLKPRQCMACRRHWGSCFSRSEYGADFPAAPHRGSCPWEQAFITPVCFVPQTVMQLDRFLVASNRTGSGCPSKIGIREEGLWMEPPGGFAAATKAKFGLESCHWDDCDFELTTLGFKRSEPDIICLQREGRSGSSSPLW